MESRHNKVGCAHDRDALSRKTVLGCARRCGAVLRHDREGLARATDQARRARQAWVRTRQGIETRARQRFFVARNLS